MYSQLSLLSHEFRQLLRHSSSSIAASVGFMVVTRLGLGFIDSQHPNIGLMCTVCFQSLSHSQGHTASRPHVFRFSHHNLQGTVRFPFCAATMFMYACRQSSNYGPTYGQPYQPYVPAGLPLEFCSLSGTSTGTLNVSSPARIALLQLPSNAPKQHVEGAAQEVLLGHLAKVTVERTWSFGYQSAVNIEGTLVLQKPGPAEASVPCQIAPFGWILCSSEGSNTSTNNQDLNASILGWLPDGNATTSNTSYGTAGSFENQSVNLAIPGVQQPVNMAYGMLSMFVSIEGEPLYLSGNVIAAPAIGNASGLQIVAFDGWLTTPQVSPWIPTTCLPAAQQHYYIPGSAFGISLPITGFIKANGSYNGSAAVMYTLSLQSEVHDGRYSEYSQYKGRYPVPEAYPGPQPTPWLGFVGNLQTGSSKGTGKL